MLHAAIPLRTRRDFLRVQQAGKRFKGRLMILLVLPSTEAAALGLTVSRRVGNAVVRNRLRRRLREIVRHQAHLLLPHHAHVVVALAQAAVASSLQLYTEWLSLSRLAQRRCLPVGPRQAPAGFDVP